MSRLQTVSRESLTPEGQKAWDYVVETHPGSRNNRPDGPFGVLIHVPPLADRVTHLESYFRFEMELPFAERELVILATVREAEARFGWVVHERHAHRQGTRPEAIEVVRAQGELDSLTARERILVSIARSLMRTRHLPDPLYSSAVEELGENVLIEVVTLVGHYNLIGFLLNSFEVPHDEEASPGF